jgi:hypothetical protein
MTPGRVRFRAEEESAGGLLDARRAAHNGFALAARHRHE